MKLQNKPKTIRNYTPVKNISEFLDAMSKHGEKTLYEYYEGKQIASISYNKFLITVRNFAAGLDAMGLSRKRIAVIGDTSPRWTAAYLAVIAGGGTIIPMDKELAVSEIEGFLSQVDAQAIVYSESFNEKFAKTASEHPTLKVLIPMSKDGCDYIDGEKTVTFDDVLDKGEKNTQYSYPSSYDVYKMCEMLFTSGTTGTSKCVMLCQRNIFSVVTSAAASVDFNSDDVIVSVLPVHHTYELACMLAEMDYGAKICINDSLRHVLKNFKKFKPTGLVLVPLFVNTMYKKIWSEAESKGKAGKLKLGIKLSRAAMRVGIDLRPKLFGEVRDAFGGRLTKIICGGAPLNPAMIEAFEDFGISIYEGCGITECAPLTSVTPYYARKCGSVGPSVPCCKARIAQTGINGDGYIEGEIQIYGENVMLGYYHNDEANKNAFTDDGWFKTGDVGYMDDDGYVYITGRLKSVIVLENGKNVFPEEVEEYLEQVDLISESVVVGRKSESGDEILLTAIVYPAYDKFENPEDTAYIMSAIQKEVTAINKKMPSFKKIQKIEIRKTEFEKTTSKKIKRHLVK